MTKVLIAGLGVSGYEATLLAISQKLSVYVVDTSINETLEQRSFELTQLGAKVLLSDDMSTLFNKGFDRIVISPGIDPQGDFGKKLQSLDTQIISELEFAAGFCDTPLIGVTGTNGKTTTVELVTHCLRAMGKKVIAAGNIGYALSRVVREGESWDYIVVEVSSFQLEYLENLSFKAGAVLNISSDHVDRYRDILEYAETKIRLLERSEYKTVSVSVLEQGYNVPSMANEQLLDCDGGKDAGYSLRDGKIDAEGEIYDYKAHPLKGFHNAENLLCCISLLNSLGFKSDDIYDASCSFKTAEHRLQLFLNHDNITFINDSKATNPDALRMALKSCGNSELKNIVLIAGGRDKKMDFKVVNPLLCSYVRKVFIYGECRFALNDIWNEHLSCEIQDTFGEAVMAALSEVKVGDLCLLSPGCSSLDTFSSYAERGNVFMKLVQEWTEK